MRRVLYALFAAAWLTLAIVAMVAALLVATASFNLQ